MIAEQKEIININIQKNILDAIIKHKHHKRYQPKRTHIKT